MSFFSAAINITGGNVGKYPNFWLSLCFLCEILEGRIDKNQLLIIIL